MVTTTHVITDDSIDVLADVDTTTAAPNTGAGLRWDGTNWVPGSTGDQVLRFATQAALNTGPAWGWTNQTYPVVAWVDSYPIDGTNNVQVQLLLKGDPNTVTNIEVTYPRTDSNEEWHTEVTPFATALLNTAILPSSPKVLSGGDLFGAGPVEQWMPIYHDFSFVVPGSAMIANNTLTAFARLPERMIINQVYIAPLGGAYANAGEEVDVRLQIGAPANDMFAEQNLSSGGGGGGTDPAVAVTGGSAGVLGLGRANDPINVVFGANAWPGYNLRFTLVGWFADEHIDTVNV